MIKSIVLFIPSIESGGVEKNLFFISDYLSKKYKRIFIVTANSDFKYKFNKNINVICPRSNKWIKKNRLIKTLIAIFLLLKNFLNKNILIFSFQSNISAILVSKLFNFNIIIRLNTSTKKYITNYIKKIFFKFLYYFADEIIVNSVFFKKELQNQLNLKSNVIFNPFKQSKKKVELKFFKNFKALKIINIGRLTDQKDQITLLRCLKLLNKSKLQYKCCIIGDGDKKEYLQNYINSNNLEKLVRLIGYKKNAENYLNSADLFVLTSKFEGLPNVLLEAQSKNIPIISSDCPTGPREILLQGKLGDLFKVGDYRKLFYLILKFTKNKKILLQKSKKAKKYLTRYDFRINNEKYYKIISNYTK